MTWTRRSGDDERGSTVVESAIVLSVVFMLLVALADFSLILTGTTLGSNAARGGARYGLINYLCADAYSGSATYDSTSCTTVPSTNYTGIKNLVVGQLAGMAVSGSISVSVECIDGTTTTVTAKACTSPNITLGTDMIMVTVTWQHLGATPFDKVTTHTDTAKMVISGAPNITATTTSTSTTSTTSTTAPTTTTTVAPTTTTTAAPTTTTTSTTAAPGCTVTNAVASPNPADSRGNSGKLAQDEIVTITTTSGSVCTGMYVKWTAGVTQTASTSGSAPTYTADLPGTLANGSWNNGTETVTVYSSTNVVLGSCTFTIS